MPNYIIFSFMAAIFFATGQVFNKLASKHSINNMNSLMAYFLLFSFIFGLFLFPFVNFSVPPLEAILPLFVAIITFTIGYYLFYAGIFQADVSTFAPLFQLQGGLIALLAFVFLGERFPLINYLWIGLLILGTVLVTIDESMKLKVLLKRGVLLILLMQVFHAISNLFVGITLKFIGPIEILFWQYFTLGVIFIPFYFAIKPRLNYSIKSLLPLFLASSISAIGAIFLFKAFQTNLTVSSTISLLNAPLVFVVSVSASRFFPQLLEHHTRKVYLYRAIGLLIILLGAFKLTT